MIKITNYSITVLFDGKMTGTDWFDNWDYVMNVMKAKLLHMHIKPKQIKQVKTFIFEKGDTLSTMKSKRITVEFRKKYSKFCRMYKNWWK